MTRAQKARRQRQARARKLRTALAEDARWQALRSTYYSGQHRSRRWRSSRERWQEWDRYLGWRIGHHAGHLFAMREERGE